MPDVFYVLTYMFYISIYILLFINIHKLFGSNMEKIKNSMMKVIELKLRVLKKAISLNSEYSACLIGGLIIALAMVNFGLFGGKEAYHHIVHTPWVDWKILGHTINLHFVANDIFMTFFFAIAAVEVKQALLPGGDLDSKKKAGVPFFGFLGGVFGPIGVFLLILFVLKQTQFSNGWGIPTATDIAIAWFFAKKIFGEFHPAVTFLVVVAVLDDFAGMGIIAVAYPNPNYPVDLGALWIVAIGISVCFIFNRIY